MVIFPQTSIKLNLSFLPHESLPDPITQDAALIQMFHTFFPYTLYA